MARGPQISTSDVPNTLQAKTIHIAPIANELSEYLVARLQKSAGVLSLDPQGFVRSFDPQGNAHLKRWREKSALELADVFKSSQDEIKAAIGTSNINLAAKKIRDYGVKTVIITRGMRGSTLFSDNVFYDVPACQPSRVLDPTGAGDVFMGAFLAEYVLGKEPLWCACVGSAAASFVVEGIGPERFGERQETYERAKEIYEKQPKK
jgi:sugar/nucleoside kinase (ribokinase family)